MKKIIIRLERKHAIELGHAGSETKELNPVEVFGPNTDIESLDVDDIVSTVARNLMLDEELVNADMYTVKIWQGNVIITPR
jgi:hypothetical protein